jgi:hypothetical protein
MSKKYIILLVVLFFGLFLAACGGKSTATPEATVVEFTSTPDPCLGENLPVEVAKVNKLMREFDDYSLLASNTPQAQLIQIIPELQRILRDAEDKTVPGCLNDLKKLQLAYMSTVVQTLISFMNTKDAAGAEQINAGIAQAQKLHGQYDIGMASLLGITLTVPPTSTPGAATPEANASSTSMIPIITVTNLGAAVVNLRSAPDLNAREAGLLDARISTIVLGKTADDQWIQVQVPGKPDQIAWVYAQLVQLSVPISSVPVAAP